MQNAPICLNLPQSALFEIESQTKTKDPRIQLSVMLSWTLPLQITVT